MAISPNDWANRRRHERSARRMDAIASRSSFHAIASAAQMAISLVTEADERANDGCSIMSDALLGATFKEHRRFWRT